MIGRILFSVLVKAPSKMLSTVLIAGLVFVCAFAFFPGQFETAQTWADGIADWIKQVTPMEGRPKILLNGAVDDMTVLSLLTTVLSRSVVELVAQGCGAGMKAVRGR